MTRLLKSGFYALGTSRHNTKILYLDNSCFIWLNEPSLGSILLTSERRPDLYMIVCEGRYHLKDPEQSDEKSPMQFLELEIAPKDWQSFSLISGLPNGHMKRSRIRTNNDHNLVSQSNSGQHTYEKITGWRG